MKNTFLGLDRILLTKTCSTEGDVLPRSSLQIKQPWLELRFISELSQLDIQWFGTAPDPHWESFTRSKTLIDTSGNAVWHHMLGFKSKNTTLPPTPALLTHLIAKQMLTLCWKRGFLGCFFLQSTYDEFRDS